MKSPNQFLFLGLAALLVASVSADQYRPHYPPPQPPNSLYCPDVKCPDVKCPDVKCPDVKCPDCRPTLTCGACQECQECQACQTCPDNTFQCPTLTLKCPDPAPVCCPGEHKDKKKHKCDNYVTKLQDFGVPPYPSNPLKLFLNQDVIASPADLIDGHKCWKLDCCAHSQLHTFYLKYVKDSKNGLNMEVRSADSVRLCLDAATNEYSIYVISHTSQSNTVTNAGYGKSEQNLVSTASYDFGVNWVKMSLSCGTDETVFYYPHGACYASFLNVDKNPYNLGTIEGNPFC